MDQDLALNLADIKFLSNRKLALRHTTTRQHIVDHLNPKPDEYDDAYAFGDLKALLPAARRTDEEVDAHLESDPQFIVDTFNQKLKHIIDASVQMDIINMSATRFYVLKGMSGADYSSDTDHQSYKDGFGKCGGQRIEPHQVIASFGFTAPEIDKHFMNVPALKEIALAKCVAQVKRLRQEYEANIAPVPGRKILEEALHQVDNPEPTATVKSYSVGTFEMKLSEITGQKFQHDENCIAIADKSETLNPSESTLLYRPLLYIAPCRVSTIHGKTTYLIDKKTVNMEQFNSYHEWKKQDIVFGQQIAMDISKTTGLNLQNKVGVITLYDENSYAYVVGDGKNEKLKNLEKIMGESGYEMKMIAGFRDEPSGVAFVRNPKNDPNL